MSGLVQSANKDERRSARLLLLNAACLPDVPRVLEDGLDKLTEEALHVALAAGKQTLQEGDVSAMGRQQQSDVGQALDYAHRECCKKIHWKLGVGFS